MPVSELSNGASSERWIPPERSEHEHGEWTREIGAHVKGEPFVSQSYDDAVEDSRQAFLARQRLSPRARDMRERKIDRELDALFKEIAEAHGHGIDLWGDSR